MGKKRFRLPVVEDAEYLCKYASGTNYFKTGEDALIKDDSHYPDWLWSIRLTDPRLEDMDPETPEYWEHLEEVSNARLRRSERNKPKEMMIVGREAKERIEYERRIVSRALASEESDEQLGFNPQDYIPMYDKKMFLMPQESLFEEELYPDEFAMQNPYKFHRDKRGWDFEPVKMRSKMVERGLFVADPVDYGLGEKKKEVE